MKIITVIYSQHNMPYSSCINLHFSKYQGLMFGFACKRNAAKLLAPTIFIKELLNRNLEKYRRKNTDIIMTKGDTLLIQIFPK